MKFHSAITEKASTSAAIDAVVANISGNLAGGINLAWVFLTSHHRENADEILRALRKELDVQTLVGCSGEGVIGGEKEIERLPGIAILAAQLEGVDVHPVHIGKNEWRELLRSADQMRARLGIKDDTRALIGLGDPWTTPLNQLMQAMDMLAPQAPLIGGMASAARSAGQNLLVCNEDTFDEGFVGVSLSGPIQVQTIVSQGGRPIGQAMIVTKGHDNVIEQLGGRRAMQVLHEMFESLPDRDQGLMQQGLLIGRAISEYRESFGRGDFLVRNLSGADEETGAIELADHIRVGQTVQFHVRDADSADEDLRLMLESARTPSEPAGGLLFSCNGRGTRMFDQPNHDIVLSRKILPRTPIAGFFAAGELGPVGGQNFIHGHTASFAFFRSS